MKRATWLLAGLVALTGCTTWQATPGSTPAPEAPAPLAATPVDCSRLAAEADTPERLDAGALRISLCNEPGHAEFSGLAGPTPPPDALVINPDAVVTAYNALEKANLAVMACTADLGPAYRLVIEYPGDKVVGVLGESYGCRVVGDKVGAQNVLDAFTTALRAQREVRPAEVADPLAGASCSAPGSWVPATVDATVAGYLCPWGETEHPMVVSAEDWATVRADWLAQATPEQPADVGRGGCEPGHLSRVVGVSAAGGTISAQAVCGGIFETWVSGVQGSTYWQPGPAASDVLGEQQRPPR